MPSDDRPLVDVRNLTVSFRTDDGEVAAVRDVSFTLDAGETLGVVGESGSGKSVTSLAVMGLLPRSRARIGGQALLSFGGAPPIDAVSASPRTMRSCRGEKVAMIFQDPMTSLNPVLRIGVQITESLRAHRGLGKAEAWRKAIELLGLVGIPDPQSRAMAYPHQLSGGMCQRVMIAMALSCEPEVLIADEPTTALDVTIQAQILQLIKTVQSRFGMAVIFITHDLGVVANVADRVAVMYAGQIVETGETDDVIDRPQHPYTQGLIRSIPRIEQDWSERIAPIRGMMPDMRRLPPGCAFHPRCGQFLAGLCDRPGATGRFVSVAGGHRVRCDRVAGSLMAEEAAS